MGQQGEESDGQNLWHHGQHERDIDLAERETLKEAECAAVIDRDGEQPALLDQFRDSLGEGGKSQSPRQSSWFEGVKNFFDDMKI